MAVAASSIFGATLSSYVIKNNPPPKMLTNTSAWGSAMDMIKTKGMKAVIISPYVELLVRAG